MILLKMKAHNTPPSKDFLTPNLPDICPAGTVNTATTRKNMVGTQF